MYKLNENSSWSRKNVTMDLDQSALKILRQFKKESPAIVRNRENVTQDTKRTSSKSLAFSKPPTVPPQSNADGRIFHKRLSLPIYSIREKILQAIDQHRIILIQGSTGSGKTTQIPQFILENANALSQPCRILCTQPRRISAIASADRVCYERAEASGGTIGYQIRLESSISQNTNCVFLTPGVFLRYLMTGSPEKIFKNITHILIDEAHERAKENDFLLTSIKEHFDANPNLKLIIMSATMDTAVFANYFGGCEEISISTKQYEVEEMYLEDILKQLNFRNRRVEELNEMYRTGKLVATSQSAYVNEEARSADVPLDEQTVSYLNEILDNLSTKADPESDFNQFVYLVQAENLPVDFRHAVTKMTALMIAVGRGYNASAQQLLNLNADPTLKVLFNSVEINSIDIAYQLHGADSDMRRLLQHHADNVGNAKVMTSSDVYNKALLNIYYDQVLTNKSHSFVLEEGIDHELMAQLIEKIHNETPRDGAILVFLPGYDDILQLAALIQDRLRADFSLFLLHSSMKTEDQKNVFKPVMKGVRKIVLSTNIAESSITIDDVVYVVDSGREKQKSYDAISHSSSLCVQWISKASANQRKGRAGRLRNGYVFRVYSSERFGSMLDTTIPQLLRTSLTEICLQTKLMVKDSMTIEAFLQKCIATPSVASIRQSIKFLQSLGALDQNEGLTLLGSHLAEMPVDAQYAKMLIYGIALKCLEPVLSIVAILSMGDNVFVLPIKPADRFKCHQVRRSLGENSVSDHFVLLKIFQLWMNLRRNNMNDRRFCEENFVSSTSMEHVKGIRQQISSYLQSSGLLKANASVLNANSSKWAVVKACLCAGLYPNVARIDRSKKSMYSDIDLKLVFHMSSILSEKNDRNLEYKKLPADWVAFEEKNRVGRTSMIKCNTLINSVVLSLTAGASLKSETDPMNNYGDWTDEEAEEQAQKIVCKIDNLVAFTTAVETGALILDLREKLDDLVLRFLSSRNFQYDKSDDVLIKTIASVLEIEERNSGFASVTVETKEEAPTTQRRFGNARNQPNGNNLKSQHSAGPSGRAAYAPGNYQTQNASQKFFVVKMNSPRIVNEWASQIVIDIEQLKLGNWLMQKLYTPKMVKFKTF